MVLRIEPLQPVDWPEVRAIYLQGIATGHATFEEDAPAWEKWDQGKLAMCRLVAQSGKDVVGWAVMVQAPIFLADLFEALASGFPLSQSISAALGREILLFFAFSIPLLAFASLTKNYMEATAAAVAVTLGVSLLTMVTTPAGGVFDPATGAWVTFTVRTAILFAGVAILGGIQYYWRKTLVSRWLTALVGLLYFLIPPVPWQTAFALE